MSMTPPQPTAGGLLREWRLRRKRSQLDLALDAEIPTRHLSYVETGRAAASRDMLLRLAQHLGMPLRQQNRLLVAGGFAPRYAERPLQAAEMQAARSAVDAILTGHEPFPALAVDRHWTLLAANAAVPPLLHGVAASLLAPPVNVLRLSLHPDGLAHRIDNLAEWRAHLLERLQGQIDHSGDPVLVALLAELAAYSCPAAPPQLPATDAIAVRLRLRLPGQATVLSFLSTTTVFGTPVDVTLSELALECFYPVDEATRAALTQAREIQR